MTASDTETVSTVTCDRSTRGHRGARPSRDSLGQVLGRDSRQVRRADDEAVVGSTPRGTERQPAPSWRRTHRRPRCRPGTRGAGTTAGRASSQPMRSSSSRRTRPGSSRRGLQLDRMEATQQELRKLVENRSACAFAQDPRPRGVDDRQRWGRRARRPRATTPDGGGGRSGLEDRGGDRVGHSPTLSNGASGPAHPWWTPTMAPHEQGPFRHSAIGQLHLGNYPPRRHWSCPQGRPRRLLLRGRDLHALTTEAAGRRIRGQHARCRPQPPRDRPRFSSAPPCSSRSQVPGAHLFSPGCLSSVPRPWASSNA